MCTRDGKSCRAGRENGGEPGGTWGLISRDLGNELEPTEATEREQERSEDKTWRKGLVDAKMSMWSGRASGPLYRKLVRTQHAEKSTGLGNMEVPGDLDPGRPSGERCKRKLGLNAVRRSSQTGK